jgi:hypothetical protein
MKVAELKDLTPVKVLLDNPMNRLELFENNKGNLFISAICSKPEGTIYYATTPSLLVTFLENKMKLQTLLEKSPSFFAEIICNSKRVLYSLKDLTIELKNGDKTIKQLTDDDPIEIW